LKPDTVVAALADPWGAASGRHLAGEVCFCHMNQ